jgi:5'-nucleotidase / UDP-sugar diphosphatase
LRASIDAGQVTMGEVLTVLPFQNTLRHLQVSGATVLAALENGVSQVEDGAGRFAGGGVEIHLRSGAARRQPRVGRDGQGEGGAWVAPIDPAKVYGRGVQQLCARRRRRVPHVRDAKNAYDYGPGSGGCDGRIHGQGRPTFWLVCPYVLPGMTKDDR